MKPRRWVLRMLGLAPVTAPAALEAAMAAPVQVGGVAAGLPSGWVTRTIDLRDVDFVGRQKIYHPQPVLRGGRAPIRIKVGLDADGRLVPRLADPQPTHNTALACAATARQMRKQR